MINRRHSRLRASWNLGVSYVVILRSLNQRPASRHSCQARFLLQCLLITTQSFLGIARMTNRNNQRFLAHKSRQIITLHHFKWNMQPARSQNSNHISRQSRTAHSRDHNIFKISTLIRTFVNRHFIPSLFWNIQNAAQNVAWIILFYHIHII